MANQIQIKRSSVAGKVPVAGDLAVGELAVNLTDKKIFSKDASNTIIELATGGGSTDVQEFSSSATWTKPSGVSAVLVELWGAGGGGGSGAVSSTGTMTGGTGGGGGGYNYKIFDASDLGSTVSVTIGAGGAGAAAITTDSTVGLAGTTGGSTAFGSLLAAYGGAGGFAGVASYSSVQGSGGGGSLSAGAFYSGGSPSTTTITNQYNVFGGGVGSASGNPQPSIYGGGAGGGVNSSVFLHYYGAMSVYGGGGGGSGQAYFGALTTLAGSNNTNAFGSNAIGGTAYVISNGISTYPAVISSTVYWVSRSGVITYTSDGTTYSNANAGVADCYGRLTYDGTYFYVTSSNGVYRSTDLATWSQVTMPVTAQWRNSLYNSGTYIFVSTTGISVTTDLVNWNTYSVTGTNNNWSDIQFDNTNYVVIDSVTSGGNIAKSTDAATWVETTSPFAGSVTSLAVNGSTWCVNNSSAVFRSTDSGSTWTNVKSISREEPVLSYVNSQFLLKSRGSSYQFYASVSSDGGITWGTDIAGSAPFGNATKAVLLGSNIFFGSNSTSIKSNLAYTSLSFIPLYYTGTNGTNGSNGLTASGGGGGGTASNGSDSGAGGSGGNGFARITAW